MTDSCQRFVPRGVQCIAFRFSDTARMGSVSVHVCDDVMMGSRVNFVCVVFLTSPRLCKLDWRQSTCTTGMTYMTVFHGYRGKICSRKCGYVLNIGESELFLKNFVDACITELEAKEAMALKVRDKHFSSWESCVNRRVSGCRMCDEVLADSRVCFTPIKLRSRSGLQCSIFWVKHRSSKSDFNVRCPPPPAPTTPTILCVCFFFRFFSFSFFWFFSTPNFAKFQLRTSKLEF